MSQLVLSLEDGAELQQMSGSCTGELQPWEMCARAGERMSCPNPLFLPGASPGVVGMEELPQGSRAARSGVSVGFAATLCLATSLPDRNLRSRRVHWPGAAALVSCQLNHSAGSAGQGSVCAAVWGCPVRAKQKPSRARIHGDILLRA